MRVVGHTLDHEGRVQEITSGPVGTWGSGWGRGKCSCGVKSEPLPTTAARQRWHRQHKAEVVEAAVKWEKWWEKVEKKG